MQAFRVLVAALAAAALAGVPAPAVAAAPLQPADPRFQDETVLEGLESPMAVRFAPEPDGRIFVAEKSGRVVVFDDRRDRDPNLVVDLSSEVHDFWDRGMLGMALDPAFAVNGRLYLLYTRDAAIGGSAPRWGDTCPDPPGATDAGCVVSGALVRVTVGALGVGTVDRTLLKDEWCQQFPSHSVGTVAFGPDGMLYVGAGEGAHFWWADWGQAPGKGPYPANPCGDPPDEGGAMRSQDVRTPADPTGLSGAIVRIDPETGEGAPGNPFASGDAGARRLIAYGLRNPFRWAFRPGTDEIWIGDVGANAWEEIDVIADADDGVAENFGWPCFEGEQAHSGYAGVPGCASLPAAQVTKPRFRYEHFKPVVAGDGCRWNQGGSISGIAFPSGSGGTEAGTLFFADYSGVCIFAMAPGADGRPDPSRVTVFARPTASASGGPVELQEGPGGDLYYTHYDPASPSEGSLHRIRYVPGNRTPEAAIAAEPANGAAPLAVSFSAASSSDPDGDALSFAWDLDGDGAFDDATGDRAARTYAEPGTVRAGVRVTDPFGAAAEAHVDVTAGNTPPRPAIESPAAGSLWTVGGPIAFRGSAEDDQEALGAGALEWILTLDHCPGGAGCHAHPIQRVAGASGSITGPQHEYPSRVVLTLVATDSGGLKGTTSVALEPLPATVRVTTDTAGTTVRLDGDEGADVRRTVIAGTRIAVATAPRQGSGARLWDFQAWSDGVLAAERLLAVPGDLTLTARFAAPAAPPAPGPAGDPAPAAAPPPAASPAKRRGLRIAIARPSKRRLAPKVRLRARCSRPCRLAARAKLRAGRSARRLPAPKGRARTTTRRFVVRIPAKARAAARRALRRQKRARLELVVTARERSGGGRAARARVRVPLKLR